MLVITCSTNPAYGRRQRSHGLDVGLAYCAAVILALSAQRRSKSAPHSFNGKSPCAISFDLTSECCRAASPSARKFSRARQRRTTAHIRTPCSPLRRPSRVRERLDPGGV